MGRNLTDSEKRILEACLRNLRSLKGCQAEFINDGGNRTGTMRIEGPWGKLDYRIMTRLRLSAASTEVAINQIKNGPAPDRCLLVTDYISEGLSSKFRQNDIDYVDAAGNASLQQPPLYVEISGRKRIERPIPGGRAFQTAGLKLIFLLLRLPHAVRWTYRNLAQGAGIALGAVGPILRELEELEYLQRIAEQRVLQAQRDLLLRWEIGYGERLQSALEVQTCRLAKGLEVSDLPDLVAKQQLEHQVLLGGELGASLLLQEKSPDTASLHFSEDALRTMLRLQLIPDPQGTIRLLKRFGRSDHWQGSLPCGAGIADPLLLHAELQVTGCSNKDLHQQLFQHYLAPHLGEQRAD